MFWFRRPPYPRWIAAALLLLAGLWLETRGPQLVEYPFASSPLAAGASLESSIEWRRVPAGLLPGWSGPVAGVAATTIQEGDPLLPSATASFSVPDDWWSIALPLPRPAAPGTRIRLVLEGNAVVEGLLIEAGVDNGFETVAMVAFAPADAPLVAAASSNSALVVMMGTGSSAEAASG